MKIIRESADTLCMPGTYIGPNQCNNSKKIASFDDPDSHAFGIDRDHARMKVSKAGEDHVNMDKDYEQELGYDEYAENVHEGRLWKDKKIISFWDSPKPEHLEKIIRAIERELMRKEGIDLPMWDDPEWRIEIMISPEDGSPVYNSKISSILPIQYMTKYVPFGKYTGTMDPERVEHEKSPMEKKKRAVPAHVGSKRYGERKPLKWRQALVPESLDEAMQFQRGGDAVKSMGLGLEAAKDRIKEEIEWKIEDDQWEGKNMLKFRTRELMDLWDNSKNDELQKRALTEIVEEWLSGLKKWRKGKGMYRLYPMLDEMGILWDPQYKVPNPNSAEDLSSKYPEKFMEYASKYFKPNQIYSTGIRLSDPELMKEGIKRGATNLNIGGTEIFEIPLKTDDGELLQLLLDKSEIDPGELFTVTTYPADRHSPYGRDYSRQIDRDESNKALRMAAKHGKTNTFRVLFNDKRSDPSATNNFALKWALKGDYWDIVEILITDEDVLKKIPLLPKNAQKKLKDSGRVDNVYGIDWLVESEFERGKDPKDAMEIGSAALQIWRCGHCGAFTDDLGVKIDPDSKEWERAKQFSKMAGTNVTKSTCDECYDEMIYQQEMESQAREQEYERQKEAEAEWRAAQEAGDYDYY